MHCVARDFEARPLAVLEKGVVHPHFALPRNEAERRVIAFMVMSYILVAAVHEGEVVACTLKGTQHHVIFMHPGAMNFWQLRNRIADSVSRADHFETLLVFFGKFEFSQLGFSYGTPGAEMYFVKNKQFAMVCLFPGRREFTKPREECVRGALRSVSKLLRFQRLINGTRFAIGQCEVTRSTSCVLGQGHDAQARLRRGKQGSVWKVKKIEDRGFVALEVSGRLEGEHLTELQEALTAEGAEEDVVLDLKQVKLVDQEAVSFLAGCEASGAELRNCPSYIREWIARERKQIVSNQEN